MPAPSKEALDRLFEEARLVLRAQREAGSQINDKASEILRFNAILIGILVTGASLAVRLTPGSGTDPTVAAGGFAAGIVLLVASTMMAVLVYPKTEYRLGLDSGDIRATLSESFEEPEVVANSTRAYVEGIERNRRVLDQATVRLRSALGLLLGALATLVLATATAILILG